MSNEESIPVASADDELNLIKAKLNLALISMIKASELWTDKAETFDQFLKRQVEKLMSSSEESPLQVSSATIDRLEKNIEAVREYLYQSLVLNFGPPKYDSLKDVLDEALGEVAKLRCVAGGLTLKEKP